MTDFTADLIRTLPGQVAAVLLLVEAVKYASRIHGDCTAIRVIALAAGVVIALGIAVYDGTDIMGGFLAVLNGILAALAAMKGYELGAKPGQAIERLWNDGEDPWGPIE